MHHDRPDVGHVAAEAGRPARGIVFDGGPMRIVEVRL
jgi:hypothetical protein